MEPFPVQCPNCGKGYTVKDPANVGRNFKCKACGTVFVIRLPASTPSPAAPSPLAQVPAAVAPVAVATAPVAEQSQDANGDDDYPDNEPTIAVSAYEAQKLREQLRQTTRVATYPGGEPAPGGYPSANAVNHGGGFAPRGHPNHAPSGPMSGQAAGFNPGGTAPPAGARGAAGQPAPAKPKGSGLLLYVGVSLAVALILLAVVFFVVLKPKP